MTRKYEMMYILSLKLGEEGIAEINQKIQKLIEDFGTIDKIDEWGRKRLAYEIDDQREGHYVLTYFTSDVNAPKEIERVLKITDGVMRYMVLRIEE